VWFWTLPCFFKFIHYVSHFELYSVLFGNVFILTDSQIKPQELKWAVPYLRGKKKLGPNTFCQVLRKLVTILIQSLIIFGLGFIFTFPFSPLMMIYGEANEHRGKKLNLFCNFLVSLQCLFFLVYSSAPQKIVY